VTGVRAGGETADPPAGRAADHCRDLVRQGDPDRYLATLLSPSVHHDALFALYAFNLEIARVRDTVSDPLPGEVRYQWWRDALAGEARGDVRSHPVAAALLDAVARYHLPRKALTDLIDARVFDLYDDPMPRLTDLEGYCGETSSALIRLAGLVLHDGADPGGSDAAGHAGVAYAVTGLLRAFPWHVAKGQLFIPTEILSAHGTDRAQVMARRDGPGLRAALAHLRMIARRHLEATRRSIGVVARPAAAAFLPVALVEPYLDRMERADYDPFTSVIELPQWRRQWRLWRAARKAGIV
jgi:15-cis-phytoene synthase